MPLQATELAGAWPGWLALVVHIPLLVLGLIFVQKGSRVGTRITYGAQSLAWIYTLLAIFALGDGRNSQFGHFNSSRAYWIENASSLAYTQLIAEVLGFLGAAAAIITILVGIGHTPARAPKATFAEHAALDARQDLEWRAAELRKWEDAYRLGHNGEAPPAGFVPPISAPPSQQQGTNVLAILALVFGLGGGLLGIIFGHISLNQIKRTGESGRGMAIAGLVLGYIGLAILIAWFVFILILANESSY